MNIITKKSNELIGAEYNPRKISERQLGELKDSIRRFGITEPIVVNSNEERKNIVISGHQRLKACLSLGIEDVPCIEVNLTTEKEKELNIRMNKNGGEFDFDLLEEHFGLEELIDWGFESAELDFDIDDVNENDFFKETELNNDVADKKCPHCGGIL